MVDLNSKLSVANRLVDLFMPVGRLAGDNNGAFSDIATQVDTAAQSAAAELKTSPFLEKAIASFQKASKSTWQPNRVVTKELSKKVITALNAFCLGVRKHAGLASVALAVIAGGWLFAKSGDKAEG